MEEGTRVPEMATSPACTVGTMPCATSFGLNARSAWIMLRRSLMFALFSFLLLGNLIQVGPNTRIHRRQPIGRGFASGNDNGLAAGCRRG